MVKKSEKKQVVNLLEITNDKIKFECKLCDEGVPHMVIVMSKNGTIHVHAPFDNKYLITQFQEAIINEQTKYNQENK